jgi:hypothetical protein
MEKAMREFDTGATRDSDSDKLDYEGFLSPLVLHRYAEYMHGHRKQADGKLRASDNWQKGIPLATYIKSLWRHFMELWTFHRYDDPGIQSDADKEDALCAIIFNASGYLHELLRGPQSRKATEVEKETPQAPELFVPQHAGHEVGTYIEQTFKEKAA